MTHTNIFKRAWNSIRRWVHPPLYVKLDPIDTSITLSKGLYRHMRLTTKDPSKVMMTKIGEQYAMVVNPPFSEEETAIADIQYNPKHRCVGFETNTPTVNRIYYDYDMGIPYDISGPLQVTLMVSYKRVKDMSVYIIRRPWRTNKRPKIYEGLKTKEE